MHESSDKQTCRYGVSDDAAGSVTVSLQGRMDAASTAFLIKELRATIRKRPGMELTVDLAQVTYLDDFGVLVLGELRQIARGVRGSFHLANPADNVKKMLSVLKFDALKDHKKISGKSSSGLLVRMGESTLEQLADMKEVISFIGDVCLCLVRVCRHPGTLRRDDTIDYMQKAGVDALPIVGLISFLLGLIMAFMSSVQLQQFGANIYVASLVSLAMVRELGPIMTAIIVAGRSGSAFAAEIGTMKISEEVDALYTMGFDPTLFLVAPKMIAAVIVVPVLVLFSNIFAILGGLVVGIGMLDLTANSYMAQTFRTLTLFDVAWGFFKSGIFALLIAGIGCLRGFQVRGGAAGVGQATTSAVVTSIFLIILSDSLCAVILRYWG